MASSEERTTGRSRTRRAVPAFAAAVAIALLSIGAVGVSSAATNDEPGRRAGAVTVECRSDVVTVGDVSMSAQSATRVDEVPSEIPEGCRVVS